MTLQEKLKSFGLDEAQIKQVNESVDQLIESKNGELQSSHDELQGKLKPYLEKDRATQIASLLPENANKDMSDDIITLAKIEDGDDDETIKSKLEEVVSSREHMQGTITDPAAKKEVKVSTTSAPTKKEDSEYTDEQKALMSKI